MAGLLREVLLREKDFFDIYATAHTTYIPSLFFHPPAFLISPLVSWLFFSVSDDPQLPHANERHCCGFNVNQYCANIHLRGWLRGRRWTWPSWNARSSMSCSDQCRGNAHAQKNGRNQASIFKKESLSKETEQETVMAATKEYTGMAALKQLSRPYK